MTDCNGCMCGHEVANGIRMITLESPGAAIEYFGVAVNAGSRDERPGEYGLAHFVEHTIFKGTSRLSSRCIINRMEAVGGELNAYTTKEETLVYSIFPTGNLSRAVALIAALVTDSVFPDEEIDRERDVVADEINSYLDIPSEALYDCFEEELFAGSELSHNILGSIESVRGIDGAMCRSWIERCYRADNMVLFYCGANPGKALSLAERHFGDIKRGGGVMRRTPPVVPAFESVRKVNSHQSHTIIGIRVPGMYDADRFVLALINNILGGPGMNSRLNVELRERRGLVYAVDSSITHYTDAGVMSIYYGCDPDDAALCRRLVCRQLDKMASERIGPVSLQRAKRQYTGQMTVSSAMTESRVLSMARGMMYHGFPLSPSQMAERIEAISADDILRVAGQLAAGNRSSLTFE